MGVYKYPFEWCVDKYQFMLFRLAGFGYRRRHIDFWRRWDSYWVRFADVSIHRQSNRPRGRLFLDELEVKMFNKRLKDQ